MFLLLVFIFISSSAGFSIITNRGVRYIPEKAKEMGAVCLDGSSPLYYHSSGSDSGLNKWYIHFEGGGWCTSFEDCYHRSLDRLGSTLKDPPFLDNSYSYFSSIASENSMMYNWNKVYIRYCDGGSFSGNSSYWFENHLLNFRGKNIVDAIFGDLLEKRGLKQSTDVVISGCSAGGLSSYLHADHIAEKLGDKTKTVVLADSGFFLDYVGTNVNYHNDMRWVFENMNSREGINKKCIDFYADEEEWKCFFAEYVVPFITTPIFALQPKFDSWQVTNVLGNTNNEIVNDFGIEVMKRVETSLLNDKKNSVFLDACFHHCCGGNSWSSMHSGQVTQDQAFSLWYNGIEKTPVIQPGNYICTECCF